MGTEVVVADDAEAACRAQLGVERRELGEPLACRDRATLVIPCATNEISAKV